MIGRAALAGLSVLAAAWSAEGAVIYHKAAARPTGATVVLGGPAAKPGAVIGGPLEPKAGLPESSGARTAYFGRGAHRRPGAPAAPAESASPQAAHGEISPSATAAPWRSAPKGKFDAHAAHR